VVAALPVIHATFNTRRKRFFEPYKLSLLSDGLSKHQILKPMLSMIDGNLNLECANDDAWFPVLQHWLVTAAMPSVGGEH
jgi:hypothetical protein